MIRQFFLIIFLCFTLAACATKGTNGKYITPAQQSYLAKGKHLFQEGRFKGAMRLLLPVAVDGIAEAEYAVGYMYYYGYGVAIDQDVGLFWIKRAAAQEFQPAIRALQVIQSKHAPKLKKPVHLQKSYSRHELNNLNLAVNKGHFKLLNKAGSNLSLSFSQPLA